ncbi:helix-turn-helix domain-containing protein [Cellulomonas sp. PSBB021]|uniref:helix-turn-helix domain-containing protein n=1 Tax=Cellulomonas sp. PSBB021 TaxID=2003551 RepID=UPI000B8D92BA|nr:helix-turn-helix transcriptional regulator [Cellulomonas sp. PSBB021]ASR55529.1 hypothetical protein CBP52_11005 [Cellulomonas sp. PSBB021]
MADEDVDLIVRRADFLIEDHAAMRAALVALRKKHGLSQSVVAERMGVSQPTVAGFEHYDANPTLATLRRYALAVGGRVRSEVVDDCAAAQTHIGVVQGEVLPRAIAAGSSPRVTWESGTRVLVRAHG